MIANPFILRGYVSDEYFCDRDKETADLMTEIKNGNNVTLIGTLCQLFVVPALFAVFQWLQERIKPIEFADDDATIDTELLQYTHPNVKSSTAAQKTSGDK